MAPLIDQAPAGASRRTRPRGPVGGGHYTINVGRQRWMDLHREGQFVIEDACFRLAVLAAIRLWASCAYLTVA
jgi:hypothetical protein